MSEPAWKRIGLKVTQESDPLALTTHLESAKATKNEKKAITKQIKRKAPEGTKKPPKRVKLPKLERKRPEPDQLAYLRQFKEDKLLWKFSKQKQNWILKNLETIPATYDEALYEYLEGIQGQLRDRLVEQLKEVTTQWNAIAEETQRKVEAELNGEGETETKPTEEDQLKPKSILKKTNDKQEQDKPKGPKFDWAVKCQKLVELLDGEKITLIGIDDKLESADTIEETPSKEELPVEEPKESEKPDETKAKESDEPKLSLKLNKSKPKKTVKLKIDEVNVDAITEGEPTITKNVVKPSPNNDDTDADGVNDLQGEEKTLKKDKKSKKDKKDKKDKKEKKSKKKSQDSLD